MYTDSIDRATEGQIKTLCEQEFLRDSKIRIMPDVHAGVGCTIGTTMTIHDKVVPNMVGVDIGCGMETLILDAPHIEPQKLDKLIYARIPSGRDVRQTGHRFASDIDLSALRCARHVNIDRAYLSIGTLGGGNHFIELDRDEDGQLYLVIHSGSRHLGSEVAKYYQKAGYNALCAHSRKYIDELIGKLKSEGRGKEIKERIKKLKRDEASPVPQMLAYVEGELFSDYIHDMAIVQEFAALNRKAMADELVKGMKLNVSERFTTTHNYIDTEAMILRKGAVSAKKGERIIVPINMRDGSLICVGKGNADWNNSAPHGAGRLMSRKEAAERFTLSSFKKEMEGIYTTSVKKDTLDECPMAYKDMSEITAHIAPTAEIVSVIKPVYNFKAGE